jgi:two-component system, OmpR family, sensor histidine kinase SenX3
MTALVAVLGGLVLVGVAGCAVLAYRRGQLADRVQQLEARGREDVAWRASAGGAQRRLTASLGALTHGVVIYDEAGEVVYRNDPAAAYLAARHSDALVEETIGVLAMEALRGRTNEHELEMFGPPRRTLHLTAVPLDDAGRPVGALVVIEDTSDRRRLENIRRDFVANISHELKTPIGALALLAETLLGEEDPQIMHRLAERIVSESLRVGRMIEDLLELSRLEVSPEKVDMRLPVADFVAEAVERVRSAADRRGITLQVHEPSQQLRVRGDRRQLVSAIVNLLDNAVKYSEPGHPVEVRAQSSDGWVEVEVRDYGIGIPRHDLERIFERFYRVDRARSRQTGGTGLGLAIVRHVASNHRGDVQVESREGEGSRFLLRLPATTDAVEPHDGPDDHPSEEFRTESDDETDDRPVEAR